MELKEVLSKYDKNELVELVNSINLDTEKSLEMIACYTSPQYFIENYCHIYDSVSRGWILFELWDPQIRLLNKVENNKKIICLKSRQQGITWLMLAVILYEALFRPPATALIMSRKEEDSIYLLGVERLRGMYDLLPEWMKADEVVKDDAKVFIISRPNGNSVIRALSTKSGDSYTGTFVLIDEADLIPNLQKALTSLEPTINAGGKLALVSKSYRELPTSLFKSIYRNADGTEWVSEFIPWYEHPRRDHEWYENMKKTILKDEGTLDTLYENYPATAKEALSPTIGDKRFNPTWLQNVFVDAYPIDTNFKLPEFKIFERPKTGGVYCIGVDTSEGLKTSDYSVSTVVEAYTGRQVAILRSKLPPDEHALLTDKISTYFNNAMILVERNNHGHSYILASGGRNLLAGHDGRKGFNTNRTTKQILFDNVASILSNGDCTIKDDDTYYELSLIEKSTLSAPEGMHDDAAIAFCLAQYARAQCIGFRDEHNVSLNARDW